MEHATSPALRHWPGVFVHLFEGPRSGSFWDFTINGTATITHNDNITSSSELVPVAGQKLLPEHLPNNPRGILEGISLPFNQNRLYNTEETRIRIQVPTPASILLMLAGLVGLGLTRRHIVQ